MRYIYTTYKTLLVLALSLLLGTLGLYGQEMNCMDGLDDDGDLLTDCFDPDCPSCDFDCEYKVPASGSGDITLMTANTGTDPDYIEVFVIIDSIGTIQYLTTSDPPTFTGVVPGHYLALVLVYQADAGISDLAVGNDINIVSSGCFAMSDSYPFEVCLNEPPTITSIETTPLCYCAGEATISETITADDPDLDSIKATVTISSGYVLGEDILSYTGMIAVPTMFDAATGTLMIGPAPPSVIDYALKNVVYQNTAALGTETIGTRTVDFTVADGNDSAGPISRDISVGDATCPCQEIVAAKSVATVDNMVCDGTDNIHVTYSFVIENTGGLDLGMISLNENLASQLGAAFVSVVSTPVITASSATTDPIINGGYDGSGTINLFDGNSGVLAPSESITVEVVVAIDNSQINSTLANQATATGTAIDEFGNSITDGVGMPVTTTDLTDNGTDPTSTNGSGGTDDTTPLLFPSIGVTKAVTSSVPTIGGNPDDYTVTYEFIVENTGTTILEDIILVDDLSSWGGALLGSPAPTVSLLNVDASILPTDNNGTYDGVGDANLLLSTGSGLLNPGESFKVIVVVGVDKSQAPIDGLSNAAMAEGVPTDGTGTPLAGLDNPTDVSDDATGLPEGDPACENPGAQNDSGGGDDATIVTFPPCPVLTKTTPSTPVELPNGNYAVTYDFVIENTGGAELCTIDLTEDFATQLDCAFQEVITSSPINLVNTSGNSTAPTSNTAYNGDTNDNLFNSDGCLFPGDEINVSVTVELDVSCQGIDDPLLNTATVCGTDPNTGIKASDDSDSDPTIGGPDDPTPLSIPNIDLAKEQISSTMLPNGNIVVEYQLTIQNTGNTDLTNVVLEDDLATQLSPAFVSAMMVSISGTASILGGLHSGFDGGATTSTAALDGNDILDRTGVIEPGEQIITTIKVEIDPLAVPAMGLTNQATTTGTDPNGEPVTDVSDDGTDPTDDTDNPTPLDLGPIPALEKTLTTVPVALPNGNFELTYEFKLKNNGTEEMCQIDVLEDFDSQFGCAFVSATPASLVSFEDGAGSTAPTFNTAYNGNSFTNIFNGDGCMFPTDSLVWSVTVVVTADCNPLNSPLANQATVNAEDPDGNPVTDNSDDDTDLDNNDTPDNESGGADDPTFAYLPNIEITKSLVSQTILPDGNVELVFEMEVENTGNTNLSDIIIEDPLTFGSAVIGTPMVSVTNLTASSPPADNNGVYNGTSNDSLTTGTITDLLQPNESFQVDMTVIVNPAIFGLLMPQPVENQATVTGTPVNNNGTPIPGYDPVMDDSDDTAELEPGSDDPTPITIPPIPELIKAITGTPVELANGNYSVDYEFLITNQGGSRFCQIDLLEDFATQYGCAFVDILNTTAPAFVNTTTTSTLPTANSLYNGSTQTNLFNTDGCLYPGDSIMITTTVEIDPSCSPVDDPLVNQARVQGEDDEDNPVEDDSDDDTDLDNDDTPDNETGGEDDPTLLSLPDIDLAKDQIGMTNLANGNVEVAYQLVIQNTGNTQLTNISLKDSIATQFSPAFVSAMGVSINGTANIVGGLNSSFNGNSTPAGGEEMLDGSAIMNPGEQIVVTIKVEIDPLLVPTTGLSNQSTTTGNDPNGDPVTDLSDDGTDPTDDTDEPTPLDFGPIPNLGKTLTGVPVSLTNGNYELTYAYNLKNNGTSEYCQIEVLDNFNTRFGCAFISTGTPTMLNVENNTGNSIPPSLNSGYNGNSIDNMFTGNSCLHPSDSIQWTVTVEVTLDCEPINSPLANIATVNGEDPDGDPVTDDSDDETDLDNNGDPDNETGGEDDPTLAYLPEIEITKELTGSTALPNGNIILAFKFNIENTGNANLSNISVTDPLPFAVIGTPVVTLMNVSTTMPPTDNNGVFDGSTNDSLTIGRTMDMLQPNESFMIMLEAEVDPVAFGQLPMPIENRATVTGNPVDDNGDPIPGYPPVEDDSDDVSDLPGEDDPTPVSIPPTPELLKSIVGTPTELANGNYRVVYNFTIKNQGGSEFCNIDLLEDFATQYGCAFVGVLGTTPPILTDLPANGNSTNPSLNTLYDGSANINLLNTDGCLFPGDSITLTVTAEIDPSCMPVDEPLVNQATVNGEAPDGNPVTDDSDDESDNPNDTGGPDDPTLLDIPDIDVAKDQIGLSDLPNGNVEVEYQLVIQNTGNTQLTNISLKDSIATEFGSAYVDAMELTISGTANTVGGLNNNFNGNSSPAGREEILDGTGIMSPGEQIIVTIKVEIDPLQVPTTGLTNQATATGNDPNGDPVSDISDDGTDPADDTDEPTPLDLGPIPELLKSVTSVPTKLANGNYTMDFSFILTNNGTSEMCNIDVLEDLDSQYGCAFVDASPAAGVVFKNLSTNSIQPSTYSSYNGNSAINMFTGNGCIFPGDSLEWMITVEVTMDCEPIPSPLVNSATVNAEDPDGNPVTDDSDDGTDLDDDDNSDNETGDDDDPTFTYFPEIEITKGLVSVTELPNGNFEMEFKFNVENTGNANLSNISVTDPLPFTTALVGTPVVTLMNVSASMPPTDNNGVFNGGTNDSLTIGGATDLLQPNESFVITMTAEVDPIIFGTLPMPVENQAIASGDPVNENGDPIPGYPPIEDESDDDSDLPGDDDPTPVSIPPVPQLTKAISGTPSPLANGNYAVTYDFIIENLGGSEFCNIDLLEDFATQYDCAFVQVLNTTAPVLVNTSTNSTTPTLNTIYNGSTQTNLLNTDGCLFPSDSITVSVTIEVDISCPTRPEPLANQATVMGEGPNGDEVADDYSDDDTDLNEDDDPDNETGGDDDPTLLLIPEITVTKAFTEGMLLPNDEYELNYEFIVENTGNVDLSNLGLIDSLVFGSALTATPMVSVINISTTSPPIVNAVYDGISNTDLVDGMPTDLLEPGQQYKVTLKTIVDIADFTALPQPVENQTTASGDDPNGNTVEDESDDESDNLNDTGGPDDPTLVSVPQIKITKDIVDIQPAMTDGNYYVTFELIVKNTGNVDLDSIQVTDDLAAEFGSAYVGLTSGPITTIDNGTPTIPNAGSFPANVYDGISGELKPQDEIAIQFTVEVDPDAGGAPTPLQNQATATGKGPNGEEVMDESDDSADPDDPDMDDPTPLPLPSIELVKEITEVAPAASGTANYHDITYSFVIENTGNVPMDSLSLVDDLAIDLGAAFVQVVSLPSIDGAQTTATAPPIINPLFIGASPALDVFLGMPTDMLLPGEQLVVEVVVEVNPSAAGADSPLMNEATASGNDPDGNTVEGNDEAELDCKPAKLSISPEALTICEGEDVLLNTTSDVAWTMHKWYNQNLSDVISSTQQNPVFENIAVTTDFVVTLCPTDGMCWTGLTDTITITVISESARPTVEDVEVCEGDLLQLQTTTSAASYLWMGPNGYTSADQNPFVTASAGLTDVGVYRLVAFNNDCPSDTATVNVTVQEIPDAPTIRSNSPICEGEDLVLSTSSICDSYQWIGPDGSSTTTLSNPLLTTTTNSTSIPATDSAYNEGLWTVICLNGNGCASDPSAALEVVIHPIPTTPTPSYSGAVCEGKGITLFAGGAYPSTATYAWYNGNPIPGPADLVSINENPIMSDLSAGTHEYWLVVTVENCSSEAVPVRVVINALPTVVASNDGTECVSPMTDINLSFTTTGGTGPYQFDWTGPNDFSSTDQEPVLPNANDNLNGTYSILITDSNGCTASASTVVDITLGPDEPFLDGTHQLCAGEPFVLSALSTYTGTAVEYIWVGPAGATNTNGAYLDAPVLNIDTTKVTDGGMYTLQVVIDQCTSLVSQPFELSIITPPNAPIVEGVVVCIGDLLQIGTETDAEAYSWTGPNGFTSEDQNPFVSTNAGPTDVGAYQLIVIQDNCPSESAIVNVTIHSSEEAPTLRTNGPICEGEDLVLSTSATCETYIWIGPDGNSALTLSNPLLMTNGNTTTIPPVDSAYDAGFWTLICQNGEGCKSAASALVEVVINQIPDTLIISNNSPICFGETVALSAVGDYPEGAIFNWYSSNPATGGVSISNEEDPIFSNFTAPGNYTYWLTVTINGCTSLAGQTQVIIQELPTVSAINNGTECVDPMTDLTISALPAGGTAPYTYAWTGPNAFASIDSVSTLPNADGDLSGTYIVVIADANGCSATAETVIDATSNPNRPNLTYTGVACEGEETTLSIQEFVGVEVNYTWFKDGVAFTNIGNQLTINPITTADIGAYHVFVEVDGCTTISDTLMVEVHEQPTAIIAMIANQACVAGSEELMLIALPEGGLSGYEYRWSGPNDFSSTDSIATLINIEASASGTYTLEVTDANGCIAAIASQTVDISDGIVEPTINISEVSCEGGEVKVSIPIYTGTNVTYTWVTPTTTNIVGLNTNELIINPIEAALHVGDYSVQVAVDGCEILSDTFELEILASPTVTPTATITPICAGGTLELLANASNAVAYQWTGPNGFTTELQDPTLNGVTILNNGNYTVTVTNSSGCTAVGTVAVNSILEALPTASIISNSPICDGADLILTSSTEGVTYEWIGPLGASDVTLSTITELNTPTGSTIISPTSPSYLSGEWQVRVTDSNGCITLSEEIEVMINEIPATPLPQNSGPICSGEEFMLWAGADYPEGTVFNWYETDPTLGATPISNKTNPKFIEVTTPTTYTYWLTVTINGCTSLAGSTTITIHELPTVSAVNSGMECVDPMTDLTVTALPAGGASPYTYSWSGPNGFASIDSIATLPNATTDLSGTYIVRITDANGCTAIGETVIDATSNPNRPNLIYSGVACEGEEVSLNIQEFAGVSVNFKWFKDGVAIANTGNQLLLNPITIADIGDYHVLVEIDGCTTISDTLSVEVHEQPSASIAMVANQPCVEGSEELQLVALPEGGSGGYTYSWNGPNGFASSDSITTLININAAISGTYTLVVTDTNGCIAATASQTVDISNGLLEPVINISDLSCEGGEVKLNISPFSGSNVTYTWTTPTTTNIIGLNTNEIIINPIENIIHQGNYSVVVEVDGCTIQSDTFFLQTLPAPSVNPSATADSICAGGTLNLFANATDAVQYNWAGPNNFVSSLPNPSVSSVSVADNGPYAVTVTNSSGCTAVGLVAVGVILEENPTASIISNSPICEGDDIVLSTSSAGVRFEWIGPFGASEQTLSTFIGLTTNVNTTTISAGNMAYTAGTYQVRVTDVNGCTSLSDEIEVVINDIPAAPFPINESPVCLGSAVNLLAGTTYPAGTIYNWYDSDPDLGGAIVISNAVNPSINITTAGTYTYWLTITKEGCTSPTGQTTIVINELPSVSAINSGMECVGSMTDLTVAAIPSGGTAPYSYVWSGPNGFASIDSVATLPNAQSNLTGTYLVTLTDVNGCTAINETVIDVTGSPNRPNLVYSGSECEGERIELGIQEFAGTTVSYTWFRDGVLLNTTNNQLILNPARTTDNGSYWVEVIVDDCRTISDTLELVVYQEPIVSIAMASDRPCERGLDELNLIALPQNGVVPYTYNWSGPNGFVSTDSVATIVNITSEATGIYTLLVTDGNGCSSVMATRDIDVTDDFLEPQIDITNQACEGEEIILEVPTYQGVDVAYNWTLPSTVNITGLNTNTLIINPVDTALHQGDYSVVITIDDCVVMSDTFNLETLGSPTVNPTIVSGTLCSGGILELAANATNATSYEWSGPDGFLSDLPNPRINDVSILNNGQYGITVTNSSGCAAVGFIEINVIGEKLEIPSFVTNSPICEGDDLVLSTSSVAARYEWIGPLGGSPQTLTTFPELMTSTQSTTINTGNPAYVAGEWRVRIVDANGCNATSEPIEVVINEIPRALAFNNGPICSDGSIQLSAEEIEGATYEWRILDDPTIISTDRTPTLQNIQTTTQYELTVIAAGCISQLDTTVVEVWEPPLVIPSSTYDLNIDCAPSDLQLFANVVEGSGTAASYLWTGPNDFTSTLPNPTIPDATSASNGTYTLAVIDENGCTNQGAIEIVNVTDLQNAPFITPSGPSCEGGMVELSVPAYSGANITYAWLKDGDTILNTNNSILILNPVTLFDAGIYQVRIAVDGCTSESAEYELEVYDNPIINIAPIAPIGCVDGSEEVRFETTVTGGIAPYKYAWTGPNGFEAVTEDPVLININATMSGSYSLMVTDANGCQSSAGSVSLDITEGNHEPIITATAPTCEGGSVTISTKDEWGSGVDFLWLKDGDTLTQIQTHEWTIFPVTAADTGAYQVIITVDGCTNISDPYTLEIYTAPSISIAPIDAITCTSGFEDLTMDATVEGGQAPFLYEWSGPNGFAATSQDADLVNVSDSASGTYSVTVTDFNGCTSETSISIDIKDGIPQPVIQTSGPVCEGNPLSILIGAYTGNSVSYNWTGPNGTSTANGDYPNASFINIVSADIANAGTYQVQVIVDGCTVNSNAIVVAVYDKIVAVPTHSGGACDSDLQLFANVNLGNATGLVFEWTGPNGFSSNLENPVIPTPSAINEGSYTLVISNGEGCPSNSFSTEVGLVSNNPDQPFIQYGGAICEGEQLVLSTIQLGGYQVNYEWTGPAGSTANGAYPNSAYLIVDRAKPQATGDYQVRITVDGCQTFTSPVQTVIVNEIPSFSVTNNGAECILPTDDIQLFALPGIVVEGLTFEWVGPNGFYSRSQNPILPNATDEYAGAYTVTVRNGSGCENSNSTTVDISRIPHQPLIETEGDICSGTILTLSTTPYWGAEVYYEWTGPAGTTTSGAYPNAPELVLTPATNHLNGNYSLIVTVNGCSSLVSEAFGIDIASPPVVTITSEGINCAAPTSTLQLITSIQGGTGPYDFEWTGPNGFSSTAANPVLANLSSVDAGTYTVMVTDASGCRSQVASQFIGISTPPTTPALDIVTPNICEGETAIFAANTYNGTSIFYYWTLQGDTTKVYTTTSPSLILEEVPAWKSGFIAVRVEVDGCTSANSGEMQFIVNDHPPTPSLAASFALCEGESLQLFTNTIADSYRWTGPNGFTSNQQYPTSIADIKVAQSGIYTLTSIVNGCESDPISTNVVVRSLPTQPVLQLASDICEGEEIVLQVLNPQPGLTYQWLSPSVMSQQFPDSQHLMIDTVLWTTLPQTVISKTAYPHLYEAGEWRVRVVNGTSCSSSTSLPRTLAIREIPNLPLMSNSGAICEGESVQLLAGGMTDAIYSWYKEIPLTDTTSSYNLVSNNQNFEANDLTPGTHRYYLQVEQHGCIISSLPTSIILNTGVEGGGNYIGANTFTLENTGGSFTEVIVHGIPTLTLPPSSGSYCTGQDISLDAPTIEGATYEWTGPNGFVSFVEDPVIINSSTINDGVYRLVVSLEGCQSKEVSTQVVVGDQPPTPTIAYEGPTCEGEEIRLTVPTMANAANVEYIWTGPDGFTTTQPTIILANAQTDFAGDYTVRIIVNGCISQPSIPMPVVVNALPAAPIISTNGTVESPLCEGESIILQTEYRPTAQYSWVGPAGFTSNLSNPIINNVQLINSGTYSLSVVENGCTSSLSSIEVGVQAAPGQPFAANTGPACAGTSFNLYIQNPIAGYRYEWYRQDGNEFVGEGESLTLNNIDIRDAGVYYAIASVGNCISDAFTGTGLATEVFTEVVIENPAKELAHTDGYVFACEAEATISAISPQFSTGFWTLATANSPARIIEPGNPNSLVTNLQTGQNVFIWSLESGDCGVTSTDTLIVEYNVPPIATDDFFAIALNEAQDLNLIANDQLPSEDINIYILTDLRLGRVVRNGNGIYTYIPNENAVGVETFRYQICHTECTDLCAEASATVVIGEGTECFAAEFVTPNNDGFNDTFTVPCLANHPGSALTIYNRYGDEIYFNGNYQNDWEGTYNGNPLPAGTYYYILIINDSAGTQLSGYIFLQR